MCYNLNIGSIIAAPAHDEVVNLPPASSGSGGGGRKGVANDTAGTASEGDSGPKEEQPSYTLRGLAHTGGPTLYR